MYDLALKWGFDKLSASMLHCYPTHSNPPSTMFSNFELVDGGCTSTDSLTYLGTYVGFSSFKKIKNLNPRVPNFYEAFPGLADLSYPRVDADSAFVSLDKQSKSMLSPHTMYVDEVKVQSTIDKLVDLYPHTTHPLFHADFVWSDAEYDWCLLKVDSTSTPGLPWSAMGCSTNADVLTRHSTQLKEAVIDLWSRYLSSDNPDFTDPMSMVSLGWCVPDSVFVKEEGHPSRKTREGRFRLIDAGGLHMQIFDRMLYGTQNDFEIKVWRDIPSCPGFGTTTSEQKQALAAKVPNIETAEADIPAFDFRVTCNDLVMDAVVRSRLVKGCPPLLERVFIRRALVLAHTPVMLSDGRLYRYNVPGKMRSGWYCTSSTNSRIRVFFGYYCGAKWIIAMGDDSIEDYSLNRESLYSFYGLPLRHFNLQAPGCFSFCSLTWNNGKISCSDLTKPLFNLLNHKVITNDLFQDFVALYKEGNAKEVESVATILARILDG